MKKFNYTVNTCKLIIDQNDNPISMLTYNNGQKYFMKKQYAISPISQEFFLSHYKTVLYNDK